MTEGAEYGTYTVADETYTDIIVTSQNITTANIALTDYVEMLFSRFIEDITKKGTETSSRYPFIKFRINS